ncbi:MAG: hypothetical protein VW125_07705 [Flavobacteriaceae bacterium]|jgi:hypothetical protein
MKNLFLGLLLSCCIFINCTDSTAEVVLIESRFSLDSLNFPIARAGLVDLGVDLKKELYEGFMNVLLFVTEGITFSEYESGELLLKGNGALFGIILYSEAQWTLNSSDYFVNLRPPFAINDIGIGFYTLDFREENVRGPYYEYEGISLLSGKMNVVNENNAMKITLEFINEFGHPIKANYTGTPQVLQSFIKPPISNKNLPYVSAIHP